MEKRPLLDKSISVMDFEDFYWLKEELLQFCRSEGLSTSGNKIEIARRIIHYLKTGEKQERGAATGKRARSKSKFNWSKEKLTLTTPITDNYKNTENVRVFFAEQIGKRFKFNVSFMNWMKNNVGKNLREAVVAWKEIDLAKRTNTAPKNIAAQFEYNRYLRDFLADNPGAKRETGIQLWKIKRSRRGDNVYRKEDLQFLE